MSVKYTLWPDEFKSVAKTKRAPDSNASFIFLSQHSVIVSGHAPSTGAGGGGTFSGVGAAGGGGTGEQGGGVEGGTGTCRTGGGPSGLTGAGTGHGFDGAGPVGNGRACKIPCSTSAAEP